MHFYLINWNCIYRFAERNNNLKTEIMKTVNRKFEGKEVINFEQKKIDNKLFNIWFFKNSNRNQRRQEVAVSRYTMAEGETLKFFKLRSLNNLDFTIGMNFKHVL